MARRKASRACPHAHVERRGIQALHKLAKVASQQLGHLALKHGRSTSRGDSERGSGSRLLAAAQLSTMKLWRRQCEICGKMREREVNLCVLGEAGAERRVARSAPGPRRRARHDAAVPDSAPERSAESTTARRGSGCARSVTAQANGTGTKASLCLTCSWLSP